MARELSAGIWWLDLGSVNAYLVEDDVLTLVDTGMPWHADAIRDGVQEAGFALRDVERILVTHFDIDHVGGLSYFEDVDAVYVGERDADFVAKRRAPPFTNWKTAIQRVAEVVRSAPAVPITPVRDGDEIGSFVAVHTPGHTGGHMVYVSTDLDVAFVGDLLRSNGDSLSPSPWYLSEDTDAVASSIETLREALGSVGTVAPGHGDPIVGDGSSAVADVGKRVGETG